MGRIMRPFALMIAKACYTWRLEKFIVSAIARNAHFPYNRTMANSTSEQRTSNNQRRRRARTSQRVPNPPSPDDITPSRPSDHVGLLFSAVLLMLAGWGGLYFVISSTQPRIGGGLWLFFACLMLAVIGTAIPFVRYLNVTITPTNVEVPPSGVIVRQSIWIGLFVVMCAWLQIPRALSLPLAFFIAMVFIVVEVFLRTREIASLRSDD